MRKTKRTYKDSLFRDIFSNATRLVEIYAALEDERAEADDIRITTLAETFFDSEKNDVSFIVGERHIILLEHQSTVNENMPLRILWYIAELYRQYVDPKLPYRAKRIALPAPKFYVFYNGRATMPQRWQLRLSDAFGAQEGALELLVEVLNINKGAGHKILDTCAPLKAYSVFVAHVRACVHAGDTLAQAVPAAMRYCIAHDCLAEYFMEKQEKEVFDMVNFQWDEELARQVRAEEAWEEGLQEGRAQGLAQGREQGLESGIVSSIGNVMKSMGFSMERAMDVLQIPVEERAKYAALVRG